MRTVHLRPSSSNIKDFGPYSNVKVILSEKGLKLKKKVKTLE